MSAREATTSCGAEQNVLVFLCSFLFIHEGSKNAYQTAPSYSDKVFFTKTTKGGTDNRQIYMSVM